MRRERRSPERRSPQTAARLARTSRRSFIKGLIGSTIAGAGAALFGAPRFGQSASELPLPSEPPLPNEPPVSLPARHGAEPRGLYLPLKDRTAEGRFGRLFKHLPPFEPPDELLSRLATTMREPPEALEPQTEPQFDNPKIPAGFTFLGQFLDHDLTFDTTPLTDQQADPDAVRNFRSARYDLDSMYGRGPAEDPQLYDPTDPAKLLIDGLQDATKPDDLPRRSDGTAIIGDPRNDENLIVCQLHLAFMKFHNGLVDHVRAQGLRADQVFGEARRLTRWHFQWVVVHDFLPRLVGQALVDQILEERSGKPAKVSLTVYKPTNPNRPMMPVEFSVAAYRFGHSMIRPRYTVNDTPHVGRIPFFGEQPTDRNLNGSRPLPSDLVVSWRFLYDIDPGTVPRPTRRIDSRLAFPLFSLPGSVVPPLPSGQPDPRVSLAERNLLRGKRLGLPSGQRVAQEMGVTPLSNGQLGLADEPGWKGEAPLWFYILKEAELEHNGEQLGAVGGRIVSEVLVGLLAHDPTSYLSRDPLFKPAPPIAPGPGQFAMADLLKFAGVA